MKRLLFALIISIIFDVLCAFITIMATELNCIPEEHTWLSITIGFGSYVLFYALTCLFFKEND